jgi:hypothetical protein
MVPRLARLLTMSVRSRTSPHVSASASPGLRPAYANTLTSVASPARPWARRWLRMRSTRSGASGSMTRLRACDGLRTAATGLLASRSWRTARCRQVCRIARLFRMVSSPTPGPQRPHRAGLSRPSQSRGQDQPRGHALPQTAPLRHRLPPAHSRRPPPQHRRLLDIGAHRLRQVRFLRT